MQMQQQMEILGNRHFLVTILVAFALHLMAYCLWHLMPKAPVVDIPVRALNIKLGDVDAELSTEDLSMMRPNASNSDNVEHIISRVVADISPAKPADSAIKSMDKAMESAPKTAKPSAAVNPFEKTAAKIKPFDMRTEGVSVAAPIQQVEARQFVRDLAPPGTEVNASSAVNSSSKDVVARYEQLISAWIDKFKPEKVLSSDQSGRVTAMVRLRIDRRGNIRYIALEKTTDSVVLDRAAVDTVRRSNPVPPAPSDYPAGDLIEFIVPVVFIQ
jgi:protein TonB